MKRKRGLDSWLLTDIYKVRFWSLTSHSNGDFRPKAGTGVQLAELSFFTPSAGQWPIKSTCFVGLMATHPKGGYMNQVTPDAATAPLIYLLDTDRDVLLALSRMLANAGLTTVASTTAAGFFERYRPDRIGCLVLDLALGDTDGFAIQQEIVARDLTLPVVFLSGCGDVSATVRAMKAGAMDFLTKPVECTKFLAAVRAAVALDCVRRDAIAEECRNQKQLEILTPREKEILPYLVSGMLNKQIAGELGVVEKTVKVHRSRVMTKLGTRTLPDLVRLADRLHVSPQHRKSNQPNAQVSANEYRSRLV